MAVIIYSVALYTKLVALALVTMVTRVEYIVIIIIIYTRLYSIVSSIKCMSCQTYIGITSSVPDGIKVKIPTPRQTSYKEEPAVLSSVEGSVSHCCLD